MKCPHRCMRLNTWPPADGSWGTFKRRGLSGGNGSQGWALRGRVQLHFLSHLWFLIFPDVSSLLVNLPYLPGRTEDPSDCEQSSFLKLLVRHLVTMRRNITNRLGRLSPHREPVGRRVSWGQMVTPKTTPAALGRHRGYAGKSKLMPAKGRVQREHESWPE